MQKNFASTILSFLFLVVLSTNNAFAQKQISIPDIWQNYNFIPKSVDGFVPMKDGEHYARIDKDAKGNPAIYVYDYKTATKTDSLFTVSRDVQKDSVKNFASLSFSFDESQQHLLIPTRSQKIYRRSSKALYYIFDIKKKTLQPLSTNGKQISPSFSPDGNKVAFVRDNNLFIKNLVSGDEKQVANDGKKNFIINGICDWVYEEEFEFVQAFQWSPDGSTLAFYRFDESAVPEYTVQFFNDLYPENYTYKYPKAGEKNSLVEIYLYNIQSGVTVKADVGTEQDQYIPRIKWTNDANALCIFRMNRLQNKLELLHANASTGKTSVMMTEENKKYIDINDNLTFFKDNKQFIWTSSQDGYNHIYIYGFDGKIKTQVTIGKWDVTAFYGLDEKNGLIYYQSAEESPLRRYVYSIRLDGSDKKKLTADAGTNDASFNSSFTYFLREHSDANTAPDYAICKSNGSVVKVLEDNSSFKKMIADYQLCKKEFFTFKLDNGTELNGWMIKPTGFNPKNKYPVFMTCYGGPGSQQVLDSYDAFGTMDFNYLAQHGYIVACVDNRGTGARGEDFEKITYLQLGKIETMDQASAAKYLGTLPYIDASRIGMMGWSYGGFMALMCISNYPDVFKSAVSVAPVTNWKFYDSIYTERYMRTPKENKDGYDKIAPLSSTANIRGKLLLVAGLADDNVHYQNTAEMLKALYKNNVVFTQMTFPDKNHGISGGNTRSYLFTQMYEWTFNNL